MSEKTLREVCNAVGVSRRAVQGYERAGLVSATCRNERGYLLYDEEALDSVEIYTVEAVAEMSVAQRSKYVHMSAIDTRDISYICNMACEYVRFEKLDDLYLICIVD